MAAGISNSAHLIAIWDATPPYCVMNPFIPLVKIHSYPGSALGIATILSARSAPGSSSSTISSPSTCLEVIKFGLASETGTIPISESRVMTSGSIIMRLRIYSLLRRSNMFSRTCLYSSVLPIATHFLISSTFIHDSSRLFISRSSPTLISNSSTRLNALVNSNLKYSLCSMALRKNA